jgi:hypothetical protein
MDFGLACDGGRMTASSHGFVLSTVSAHDPILLCRLYEHYEAEKDLPDHGPYTGAHCIQACFVIGMGVGPDDLRMAEKLCRASWGFGHAANRVNIYFRHPTSERVSKLRFSFQDDKKQAQTMAGIGTGSAVGTEWWELFLLLLWVLLMLFF